MENRAGDEPLRSPSRLVLQPHVARQPGWLRCLSATRELRCLTVGPLLAGPLQSQCPKCVGLLYTALVVVSIDSLEMDKASVSLLGLASGHGRR